MHKARNGTAVVLLSLATAMVPARGWAQAISIRTVTKVPAGQSPKLTITANRPVEKIEVLLSREDGKLVAESVGDLAAGGWRDVMLDATPGKHQYTGRIGCVIDGKDEAVQVSLETIVSAEINLLIDKSRVDWGQGRMEIGGIGFPEGKVEVKVSAAADGAILVDHEQDFSDHVPGAPLIVAWKPQAKGAEVGRIDVKVSDENGAFGSVALFPWSVKIPHDEVLFATDSAVIAAGEAPKLEASLAKINDALAKYASLGAVKLYVAGHTDTVGTAKYNLGLSLRRAQSIATWFRKSGLQLPIAYEGYGEQALRVQTPDNTDEPRNRWVDYILSIEDPVLKATDFRPTWKLLK